MNRRPLVTIVGGAGFAGLGLTQQLLERGYRVRMIDLVAPNHIEGHERLLGQVDYVWKSLHDLETRDLAESDVICHLAAQADVPMGFLSPVETCWVNVVGTVKLLEAVRGLGGSLQKFIYASTGNVFGRADYVPIDESHRLTPHNPYAASKAAAELYCRAYRLSYGLPLVTMSNGAVIGPGMRREIFVYKWLENIALGRPVVLEGGDQTRDLTYVSDVLDAWTLAIEAPPEKVVGEKFQVSYGEKRTVRDILDMCMKAMGKTVEVVQHPYRPGEEGMDEEFTNAKARRVLGYEPRVPPEEGIRLTAEWVRMMHAQLGGSLDPGSPYLPGVRPESYRWLP